VRCGQPDWCVFADFENELFALGGPQGAWQGGGCDAEKDVGVIPAFGLLLFELATARR
jgi:hypothetical protein